MKLDQSTTDKATSTKWGCSLRTARRWRSQGLDLENDLVVIKFILANRSATNRMLAACKRIIKKL